MSNRTSDPLDAEAIKAKLEALRSEHRDLDEVIDRLIEKPPFDQLQLQRLKKRKMAYASAAKGRGLKVIVAGAGGAAHLPGMTAALTPLPVLGVPVESAALKGQDSLLSIVQMPAGIPVGTLAIGRAGAVNAALLAARIVGLGGVNITASLARWRARQTDAVALAAVDDPALP